MRTALGWTAALSVAMLGCGSETASRSAPEAALKRDITLHNAAAPAVEVASAVELGRAEPQERKAPRRKPSPKPAPAPTPDLAPEMAPAADLVVVPVRSTVAEAPAPSAGGRELAPGNTVQVLPASTGAAATGIDDLYLPGGPGRGIKEGGAGHCPTPPTRPGRPIGIVGYH